ncbi:MAG: hypothetical protein WCT46_06705, partial [Candidatus Gracilibacteria bacterium]
ETMRNDLESEMVTVYASLGDVLANSSYCADSEEEMRKTYNLAIIPSAQMMILGFLNGSNWQDLQEREEISDMQLCYDPDLDKISFVLYVTGNEEYNNIIGTYDNQKNFVTDEQYNNGSGDIGFCNIDGYLGGDLVYSCNGGDGPGGWQTVYVLKSTGESTLVKDCVFNTVYSDETGEHEASTECSVDLLIPIRD